jgi:hypothetical protein
MHDDACRPSCTTGRDRLARRRNQVWRHQHPPPSDDLYHLCYVTCDRCPAPAPNPQDISTLELKEPCGWIKTDLWHLGPNQQALPLRAFCLQVGAEAGGALRMTPGCPCLAPAPAPLAAAADVSACIVR